LIRLVTHPRATLVRAVLGVLLGGMLVSGCTTLPESGAVHRVNEASPDQDQEAPYFQPPGPTKDATPSQIVSDFLTAMQANPLSTSVARTFLTTRARAAWKPNRATIVYEAPTVLAGSGGVRVRLADARRLDARGGWRGGTPGRSETIDFQLVNEAGQWRIDNPVNALVVPSSFFDRSFERFNLYFFDQTGRTLLPDPVFIPRGEQSATNLVRGLLSGPGAGIADISNSALPSGTTLDLSVVVTESGVAEVPLSRQVLTMSRAELSRAVDQLAWTLRQVPGIERLRITVGGSPVPLPNGSTDAPVTSGPEYDAAGTGASFLWGLRGGRVVDLGSDPVPISGPLGRPGYPMRSLAVSESPRRIAAVSTAGRTVFVAPVATSTATRVTRVVSDGTDVLRPQYDMFGDLWLVDRTASGARVLVVSGRHVRTLDVPGVTGANVAAFAVARDGSRLAVAYAGNPAPALRVVDILRTDEGIVSGAGRSRTFSDGRSDSARIVDLGWRDPATLAVLARPTEETSEVTFVSSDGSPVSPDLIQPNVFRGAAAALVVAPETDLPLHLITPDQRLYTLSAGGAWPRSSSKVAAATFVR
jgi:Lipoprotein LpqB beta-propeller domain/Sporulation and spore germination